VTMSSRVAALAVLFALAGCPDESRTSTPQTPTSEAPKTTEPSTTKAPTAAPFDRATAKTPWRHAKVGDWATYKMNTGRGTTTKFEVTGVTDSTVTFIRKHPENGAVQGEPITVDLADEESKYKPWAQYDALVEPPTPQKMTVAGKEVEGLVIKRASSNGSTTELWVAENDVPAFNQCAVKSIRNGNLEMELLDFGRGP
jgi:hypothetical protein